MHVHVESGDGESKFWLEPEIELARNHGMNEQDLARIKQIVEQRQQEIRDAWNQHFLG